MKRAQIWAWIIANWMYAGLIASLFLLALLPLLTAVWSLPLLLVYVLLPLYMIHQVEEHAGDRFRLFANRLLGDGRDVLTHLAVVVINVGGVWLVYLATLYAAVLGGIGYGLVAVYTTLVNAVLHIAPAIKMRAYNPGLYTAGLLFVPVGLVTLWSVARAPGVTGSDHGLGLSAAILIHAAIMVHATRRAARLKRLG
jgi:hypothetical protein